MAEFVEVIGHVRRICDTYDVCGGCPLNEGGCLAKFTGDSIDTEQIEKIVMDWAKEHPEPVYPSWKKGWKQLFPDGGVACPSAMFDSHLPCTGDCTQCTESPMSPHIAEKLGIKPIGGE